MSCTHTTYNARRISCHSGKVIPPLSIMIAFNRTEDFFDQEPEFDL